MILPRLTLLKQEMSGLLERVAQEHFGQGSTGTSAAAAGTEKNSQKMPLVFLINNLYFIVTQL